MAPQPFWTSKTFWVLVVGILINVLNYYKVIPEGQDVTLFSNSILMVLGIVFRWTSNQPLTTDSKAKSIPNIGGGS